MVKDATIKGYKIKDVEYRELVYPNLYVVVSPKSSTNPKGRKSWVCRVKYKDKQHVLTLGDYLPNTKGHISLADAVARVIDFKSDVRSGAIHDKEPEKKKDILLSQYTERYARYKGFDTGDKRIVKVERAIGLLISQHGDRPPHEYSKQEINDFIDARLGTFYEKTNSYIKTGTVDRELNAIRGAINLVNEQEEIDHLHRFHKPNIPHKGEDKRETKTFTAEQINTLREVFSGSEKKLDLLPGLLIDTGLRISEAVGLAVDDIVIKDDFALVVIHKNSLRRLKTKNSKRFVPLVGTSLESAKTLKEICERSLNPNRKWVFPSYLGPRLNKKTKEALLDNQGEVIMEFRGDYASKAVNDKLKRILGSEAPTSHSFRHTIQTRLRNVECPEWMRNELCGWAKTISEKYGTPSDVKVKTKYLVKSLENNLDSGLDSLI